MRWMVANVSQTHQCEFIVNVYLSGHDSPQRRQSSLFATGKLLHTRKNQQWRKPAETSRNMWEKEEEKSSGSHRKSAEKFICFVPIYDVVKRKFKFPFYVRFKSSCQQLCANISITKNGVNLTTICVINYEALLTDIVSWKSLLILAWSIKNLRLDSICFIMSIFIHYTVHSQCFVTRRLFKTMIIPITKSSIWVYQRRNKKRGKDKIFHITFSHLRFYLFLLIVTRHEK